jgi:hypothetical protein
MNIGRLLRTPPPVHAFALGEQHILYGLLSRHHDALLRVEHTNLEAPYFELGPVGVLHVDRQMLGGALSRLVSTLGKRPKRSSVVVPNTWVRSVVLDAVALPRQRQEAESVLRWRLKKLLPCRPEDVRLDFIAGSGNGRVLVVLALDRPLAVLEEAFAALGIEVGRIEPSMVALSALLPPMTAPVLLVTLEPRALALVAVAGGGTLLLRHKPLPGEPARAHALIQRELSRTLAHLREKEKLTGAIETWLASAIESGDTVQQWAEQEGLAVRQLALGAGRVPRVVGVNDNLVWSLLATGWAGEV